MEDVGKTGNIIYKNSKDDSVKNKEMLFYKTCNSKNAIPVTLINDNVKPYVELFNYLVDK